MTLILRFANLTQRNAKGTSRKLRLHHTTRPKETCVPADHPADQCALIWHLPHSG